MYKKFLKGLATGFKLISYHENFDNVKIVIETPSLEKPTLNDISETINNIPSRDIIRFIILEGEYEIVKYSSGESIEDFFEKIKNLSNESNEDDYRINITIVKDIVNNQISIYDLELFIDYLDRLSLKGILSEFNKVLQNEYIVFRLQNDNYNFFSNSIFFISEKEPINFDKNKRSLESKKRIEVCNFLNSSEYTLLASDFNFDGPMFEKLKIIMNKLKIIFSIISICDISYIKNINEIQIILNGYKRIDTIINYKDNFDEKANGYYKVQQWIYNEGDLNDKIGIARNIISIATRNCDLMCIDNSIMASIKSAHEIYLKENIKQYLEVKSKISEFLNDMTQKTSEVANSLGKSLYSNIKVALTFYATIVIMNILNDKRLSNIFTTDVLILSVLFVIFSFLFMLFSKNETNAEIDRFKMKYKRVKESYNEVLNKDDISTIFKNDMYFKEDLQYIKDKIYKYTHYWYIVLATMLVAIFTIVVVKYIHKLIICIIIKILELP